MTSQPFSPFEAPALIARPGVSSLLTPDGEILTLPNKELTPLLRGFPPPLLVHGPEALRLLDLPSEPQPVPWFDLLELFLFVYPAQTVTPTPRGLALRLGLLDEHDDTPLRPDALYKITRLLLRRLEDIGHIPQECASLLPLAELIGKAGWSWAESVNAALTAASLKTGLPDTISSFERLKIWKTLPQWEDKAPRPQAGTQPISPLAARKRLAEILGPDAETRAGQADFSSVTSYAFHPREKPDEPNIVLAEAGTGTGKTLGYIAPASLWTEKNDGTVWISTYTRHLQRQIEQELTRLYPDPAIRREKVVLRKGRENYLCLLNLEEIVISALNRSPANNPTLIALVLLARWAENTADGDLQGGDLPGWFGDLFGPGLLSAIADRRGECIHSACGHYQSCFIENSIRKARYADLVIANHALTLSQASWNALVPQSLSPAGLTDENGVPSHIIFDEGHHIFDASDNAFALTFSGLETAELRRWILGNEGGRSRARGLYRRMDDLQEIFPPLKDMLQKLLLATQMALPQPQWSMRLQELREERASSLQEKNALEDSGPPAILDNPSEDFLQELDAILEARLLESVHPHEPEFRYGRQEVDLHPVTDNLLVATNNLIEALQKIVTPLDRLIAFLADQLEENAELELPLVQRLEALIRSLYRRALSPLQGWIAMLRAISTPPEEGNIPLYVDFIQRERFSAPRMGIEGLDIGLHRHWLDPTIPFASTLQGTTHGLLITSATLRDQQEADNDEQSWKKAEQRVGIPHFLKAPVRASLLSPFDYGQQTRAYVITDVSPEITSLSRAFQVLFEASRGGALGLFTAINRLKAVYKHIQEPLSQHDITLYAQHVDVMDNATLVDIFRTERHSCLLGTDSMRDGVDVPGDALRMVVFERTPWPRPDILHRERRRYLSGDNPNDYDDFITRMRLRQAFGRLIRRRDDKGVFVMLDRRLPTRLLSAFPHGVEIKRLKLAEALQEITGFLYPST
ncbi:ATP-dependent DNA helicase [Acetobacteraceae bacterium ESL0709]|nr:ATP-dependent DNA helicase [Acetobacteraceae bacterium ESL0697]MDF7677822.1 ATP-dependent DNA helicase [Acetobacteraceae bacterium ESL0709]